MLYWVPFLSFFFPRIEKTYIKKCYSFQKYLYGLPAGRNTWYKISEWTYLKAFRGKKKQLSCISEHAGSCWEFFAAVLHRSIQISWILCQNTSNASVNLTNISCWIQLSKAYLTSSLEGQLCVPFQGTNRSQISKDFEKWIEINEKLTSWLCSCQSCASKGGITKKRQMNSAEGTALLEGKNPLSIARSQQAVTAGLRWH